MNQAIHNVDLLQWMMGTVTHVTGFTGTLAHERIEVEDTAVACLRFANGALGVIQATTSVHPGYPKTIAIHGDKGSAVIEQEDVFRWDFNPETEEDKAIRQRFAGRLVAEDLLLWLQLVADGYGCWVLDAPLAFTYRPEFSPGGYSGDLWRHEMRELRAIKAARQERLLPVAGWLLAAGWSLLKYVRRVYLVASRRVAT